jgi:hypothetical protein
VVRRRVQITRSILQSSSCAIIRRRCERALSAEFTGCLSI